MISIYFSNELLHLLIWFYLFFFHPFFFTFNLFDILVIDQSRHLKGS